MNAKDKKKIYIISIIILVIIIAIVFLCISLWKPVRKSVVIEVGNSIEMEDFLTEELDIASFKTDIEKIDTSKLGEHSISIKILFLTYESQLKVVDTIPPTGKPIDLTIEAGTPLKASDCVTDIIDSTNVSVEFKETPDIETDGTREVVVFLVDEAGNKSEVKSNVTVWSDKEAPVISGASNKTITVGGTISYRQNVTVTDNIDENPQLEIDNSGVDLNKVGKYQVTYTATDKSGNSSSKTITINVVEKEPDIQTVDEATVKALALNVLNSITNESMSKMEVAFAIYKWTNKNIAYTGSSDKSNWVVGAYQAFTKKSGDCYNYYAAAKALFEVAGIENVDVVKSDTSRSRHYWSLINLGDGWYHVDATPRKGDGDLFFMVTDAELEAYSSKHSNSHVFDKNAYPERATESLQDKINYSLGKITE